MSLKRYLSKRKLQESFEPNGKILKRHKKKLQFVVQKHAATHLHYDLRLEVDGVLKSWAIPKGPSLDPSSKRLAIQVEDHPFEYRNFEGVIPKGYGAGTVMIWDRGTYEVEAEIGEGLKKGEIHFTLNGEKLHGSFSLIKFKKEGDEWLLIKRKDAFATKKEVTQNNRSVVSNKTLEEISEKSSAKALKKGIKKKKPHWIKPMLATLVEKPFDHPEWVFEIKWDGFRALAELNFNDVEIYSRNLQSFNARFSHLVQQLKSLQLDAILDGEIVVLDKKGISRFQLLQNHKETKANTHFYVFDLLYLNGRDLRGLPLIERKSILKSILKSNPSIHFMDHIEEKGKKFFQLCQQKGVEGVIGKKKTSVYETGKRSPAWVKIHVERHQEVIICGFTEPRKGRKNFGALIAGVYEKGVLHFAGHVGGGFTEKQLEEIKTLLSPFVIKKCPFKTPLKTNTHATWVKPKYVCEVKFKEWTEAGILRMPIFLGIREDKPLRSVIREYENRH